jgi:hypothetical protein
MYFHYIYYWSFVKCIDIFQYWMAVTSICTLLQRVFPLYFPTKYIVRISQLPHDFYMPYTFHCPIFLQVILRGQQVVLIYHLFHIHSRLKYNLSYSHPSSTLHGSAIYGHHHVSSILLKLLHLWEPPTVEIIHCQATAS